MKMPDPDKTILAKRNEIIGAMNKIVKKDNVIVEKKKLAVYESDGLTAYKQLPLIVVLPETVEQISSV